MPIQSTDTVKNHYKISKSTGLTDILIEFERVLDELGLYTYQNWIEGEIVEGPHLSRYWIELSLMYPREKMPDPTGGMRLIKKDCKVSYQKDYYLDPRRVEEPADYQENGSKKPKVDEVPVWIVNIKMPKKYVTIDSELTDDDTEDNKPTQTVADTMINNPEE